MRPSAQGGQALPEVPRDRSQLKVVVSVQPLAPPQGAIAHFPPMHAYTSVLDLQVTVSLVVQGAPTEGAPQDAARRKKKPAPHSD